MSNEITYRDVVSQIKDRLDIVDVVSRRVILKKTGNNYWGLCPFHNEKTPSFSVNAQKQIYKCFGCGEGGDVLSFLMKINNQSFNEVVKEQAEILGIELPKQYSDANQSLKQQMCDALLAAADYYTENLLSDKNCEAYKYLQKRGFGDDVIYKYKLGVSKDSYEDLHKKLLKKYNIEILEKAGLVIKRDRDRGYVDRFKNRLMIPIFDEKGNVVAFGARTLEKDGNPKYLNSAESLVYNKSQILYGLYQAKEAIKKEDSVIIMEGYFDVISAQVNGVENAVGACGTALTENHVKMISRYSDSRRIFLAFDSDGAGRKATERGAETIKEAFTGLGNIKQYDESFNTVNNDRYACEIRVITPPDGKDPDEFIREHGSGEYKKYVESAQLLIDFQINQVLKNKKPKMTPLEKNDLVKQVVPYLQEINNTIVRDEYVKIVATQLEIDENSLKKVLFLQVNTPKPQYSQEKKPIVKKSLNISEKAQKNLLSMYLVNESSINFQTLNNILKEIEFTNDKLIIVKNTIDKLTQAVNNVKELTETLYTEFAEDNELKEIITDLIYLSDSFKNLSDKDFKIAIEENIDRIKTFKIKEAQKQLQNQYKEANDDELQAVQIQMQLREKIKNKQRTGDN